MHLPTHPPLGLAFAMRKHGAQNSSTMSGLAVFFSIFFSPSPTEMPAVEAMPSRLWQEDVSTKSCYTKIARVNGALILH